MAGMEGQVALVTGGTRGIGAEVLDGIVAQVPLERLGEPDEVARVIEFLADPGSGYITGEVYGINGGLYM